MFYPYLMQNFTCYCILDLTRSLLVVNLSINKSNEITVTQIYLLKKIHYINQIHKIKYELKNSYKRVENWHNKQYTIHTVVLGHTFKIIIIRIII